MTRRSLLMFLALSTGCIVQRNEPLVTTPEPPGANCPGGGEKIQEGNNGPIYVCNEPGNSDAAAVGSTGTLGDTGPTGAAGSTGPTGASAATGAMDCVQ